MADSNTKKGQMTVEEAGRKGGQATSDELHGTGFYKEIGHEGGEATAETHGKDFYQKIGQKGGTTAARNQGKGQFAHDDTNKNDQSKQSDETSHENQNESNDQSNDEGWLDKIF